MEKIGLLPCGGQALRMKPLQYPKELLPISYEKSNSDNSIFPKLSIEYAIESYKLSDVKKCYIVIPDWKPELMRYLGDGKVFDIDISYLYNNKSEGLADAIYTAQPWCKDKITCLALPDTQFFPRDGFKYVLQKMHEANADLVLGVFPTNEPQNFGCVEFGNDGRILSIVDKPEFPKFLNAWGIAAWKPNFWQLFSSVLKLLPVNSSITEVFNLAIVNGLNVYGVYFPEGRYYDIGRYNQLPIVFKD